MSNGRTIGSIAGHGRELVERNSKYPVQGPDYGHPTSIDPLWMALYVNILVRVRSCSTLSHVIAQYSGPISGAVVVDSNATEFLYIRPEIHAQLCTYWIRIWSAVLLVGGSLLLARAIFPDCTSA